MALLTLQYTTDKPPEYVVVLAFLAGCVELLMGILRLGEFVWCFESLQKLGVNIMLAPQLLGRH